MTAVRVLLTLLLVLCSLVVPVPVAAQMTGNVDKLKADLHGEDLDRAVAAASALGSLKGDEALDALMGALQLGSPPKLTLALLEAMELHQSPRMIDLVRVFAHHRRPELRVAAVKAIGAARDARAVPPLIAALADSSPMVRARAARILAERNERRAERSLFQMLRQGDETAAVPLGTVGGVETAKNLAELIGELPDAAVASALGTMLRRSDFGPDPLRNEVVNALTKIPGLDATAALVEYIASVPEGEVRISKQNAEKALEDRQQ